jgi:hypothetical protein
MREPLSRFSGFPVVACAPSPSFDALRLGFWCGLGSETPPQDVLSSHSTLEWQSLFESHRQRRWLTRWSQGAPEVERAYTRAHELCQQVGETPELFPVLWGL